MQHLIILQIKEPLKEQVISRIKERWQWAKITPDVWCIVSHNSCFDIRDELCVGLKSEDRILVVDITDSSWASRNLPDQISTWLKND